MPTKKTALKDIRHGEMNALEAPSTQPRFDPSRAQVVDVMRNNISNHYTANTIKGKRRWNAIVLKSTQQKYAHVASEFQRTYTAYERGNSDGEFTHFTYKIFIAELDSFKKLPEDFRTSGSSAGLLYLCRDAISPLGKNWGKIDYGTPVEVVFEDQERLRTPIITDVHSNRRIALKGEKSAQGLFRTAPRVARESAGPAEEPTPTAPKATGPVTIAAHRGCLSEKGSGYQKLGAPENSRASILGCLQDHVPAGGLPFIIEVDIRKTSDNHLILMHDSTIDRTTTGSGRVSSMTLAQIQQHTLRWKRDGPSSGHSIATLAEILPLIAGKNVFLNLDKVDVDPENAKGSVVDWTRVLLNPHIAPQTGARPDRADLVGARKILREQCLFKDTIPPSRLVETLGTEGGFLGTLKTMPIIKASDLGSVIGPLNELKALKLPSSAGSVQLNRLPFAIEIKELKNIGNIATSKAEEIQNIRALGVHVWANALWSDDNKKTWEKLADAGVSIIQTDKVAELQAFLQERKV